MVCTTDIQVQVTLACHSQPPTRYPTISATSRWSSSLPDTIQLHMQTSLASLVQRSPSTEPHHTLLNAADNTHVYLCHGPLFYTAQPLVITTKRTHSLRVAKLLPAASSPRMLVGINQ